MNVGKFTIIAVAALIVLLLAGLLGLYISNERLRDAVQTMGEVAKTEAQAFNAALGRAETKIDTTGELIKTLSSTIPDDIRRDLDKRDAEIIAIATARFGTNSRGQGRTSVTVPIPKPGITSVVDSGEGKLPTELCNVGPYTSNFSDWRLKASLTAECGAPGEFQYELNQKFELVQVSGDDNSTYINLYELDADGKKMPKATVEKFDVFKKADRVDQFYWWALHLDIAGGVNHNAQVSLETTISLMGYGKTDNDLSWRFLRGGLVYSGGVGAVVCPVSYNVGGPLPLLSNVWISPCYQHLDTHAASVSIGAQL